MTDNRYFRLQDIEVKEFALDAPVEIEKGALLLEANSKTVILQLRLIILDSLNKISSISLNICGYTDNGEPIENFAPHIYTYMDVHLEKHKSFGDKTPIILDPRIRNVEVKIEKIVFLNGKVWQASEGYFTTPLQEPVSSIGKNLLPQFERETSKLPKSAKQHFHYIPRQFDNYWQCTCGRPNKNSIEVCKRCGLFKKNTFRTTSEDYLQSKLQKFIENARLEEENRLKKEAEREAIVARRAKQLNVMKRAIYILLLVIAFFSILFFWITPTDREAITSVTSKIESIGQIDRNSGEKIEEAENAYFALNGKLQKRVKNSEILFFARTTYDELLANDLVQAITKIGKVTVESEQSITAIYNAYSSLTEDQKRLVNNYEVLEYAKDNYNQLKADLVIASINSIGYIGKYSGDIIQSTFEKYELLTSDQKALVSNLDILEKAQQTYDQLRANNVVEAINLIGVVTLESKNRINSAQEAYNLLTPTQQQLVTNYDAIQISRDELSKLEVNKVITLIDALGEHSLKNSVPIIKAKAFYDELTPTQKELVTNSTKLDYFVNELSIKQVNNVISVIDSIDGGTIDKEPQVIEARALYEELDTGQKQNVTNYDLLLSFEQDILESKVSEINKFISTLDLNYLKASDETEAIRYNDFFEGLPTNLKSEVKEFSKLTKAIEIFRKYRLGIKKASDGNYKDAYYLMIDLNYLDSSILAREYEKIAFRWRVEGGMTKEIYRRSEKFKFVAVVYGGKPGETIDISITCKTPDWSLTSVKRDLRDGWGWDKGNEYYFYHERPQLASNGVGTVTIRNYSTGEVLAEYRFEIFGN